MLKVLLYSEILAAILAIVFYNKYKNTDVKYLLIILITVVVTEQLGGIMANKRILLYKGTYSYWLFNIMFPFWKMMYLLIFYKTLETINFKKWVKSFMIIYPIAVAINWLFLENFLTDLESHSRIIGSLFLVISAIFYLVELLRSDKIILFHRKLLFWISVGILIFYGGTIPFSIVQNYYSTFDYVHNLYHTVYILGSLMYLIFSFGFIWSKKE